MNKKYLVCAVLSAGVIASAAAFGGCFTPGGNNDDATYEQDNMHFALKEDGTYELESYTVYIEDEEGTYTGDGEEVEVPATVNGKNVTSLKEQAFDGTAVKSVVLPNGLTEIPEGAFERCPYLSSVNIPDSVTAIAELAFYDCPKLASITLPDGVTSVGNRAFENCTTLSTVTIPASCVSVGSDCFIGTVLKNFSAAGLESIGDSAFYYVSTLESVNIPAVKTIGEETFRETAITEINLPSVETIGDAAFVSCANLEKLTIGGNLKSCATNAFSTTDIKEISIDSPVPEKLAYNANGLTKLTLGEGITSIGSGAFYGCSALTSLSLPAALTSVGDSAFGSCTRLAEIELPEKLVSIGNRAFYRCAMTSLSFPASLRTIGDNAFESCNDVTSVTFAEGTESIGERAFHMEGAEELEIVLPSTVKTLGANCFLGITAAKLWINEGAQGVDGYIYKESRYGSENGAVRDLKVPASYVMPSSDNVLEKVTVFGEGEIPAKAYESCSALTEVAICAGVNGIGRNAFYSAHLTNINLDTVDHMGEGALGNIDNLQFTKTEKGVNYIDDWIISSDYSGGNGETTLDLTQVKGVYDRAFKKTDTNDTSKIDTIIFAVGSDDNTRIKYIGNHAFSGTGVRSVQIPASATGWEDAFYNCNSLQTVLVSDGVTEIADSAFSSCGSLTSVQLPDSVKKIGNYAFSNCVNLLTVNLNKVETVGEYAFFRCSKLGGGADADHDKVVIQSVKALGTSAFDGCSQLTAIHLPSELTSIGFYALGGVEDVYYGGTEAQWEAIEKHEKFRYGSVAMTVHFSDGSTYVYAAQS